MPWRETCPMEERLKYIGDWLKNGDSVTDLCRIYGISRKTGYKWIERYQTRGLDGLGEMSRATHGHPNQTPALMEEGLVLFRHLHPHWGPRKLVHRLKELRPNEIWPAASTAGAILKRHGLTKPPRRRKRTPIFAGNVREACRPNDVWATDFKGWFRTRDGGRVDPLTITDLASRYLIECRALTSTTGDSVRPWFEAAFREFGLPWVIRSDNGPPFASVGLGGLSRLSVWWIRLGIIPERIRPGHPEENGCHERMHRSLAEATIKPPEKNIVAQQGSFTVFRREFNDERPHESLGMATPARIYRPSERTYPRTLPELEYGNGVEVRRVRSNGEIKWGGGFLYVSEALIGEQVGLRRVDNDRWTIHFGPVPLAMYDASNKQLQRCDPVKLSPMCLV